MSPLIRLLRSPLAAAALLLVSSAGARSLEARDEPRRDHDADVCNEASVEGIAPAPHLNGLPIAGVPVEIVGDRVKVLVESTPRCDLVTAPGLPYRWRRRAERSQQRAGAARRGRALG